MRDAYRDAATELAAFGPIAPIPDRYDAHLGLFLNVERLKAERVTEQASAFALATGGKPDPALCAALGRTPEESAEIMYRAQAQRREAALLAKFGFTP